jgi:hypothetical protein
MVKAVILKMVSSLILRGSGRLLSSNFHVAVGCGFPVNGTSMMADLEV